MTSLCHYSTLTMYLVGFFFSNKISYVTYQKKKKKITTKSHVVLGYELHRDLHVLYIHFFFGFQNFIVPIALD